jgi:hypothetical protein
MPDASCNPLFGLVSGPVSLEMFSSGLFWSEARSQCARLPVGDDLFFRRGVTVSGGAIVGAGRSC